MRCRNGSRTLIPEWITQPDISIVFDHENEGRAEGVGDAGNKVLRRSMHVGTFKIERYCLLALPRSPIRRKSHGNNSSRKYGPPSQKVRFYCARDIEFRSKSSRNEPAKKRERGEKRRAGNRQCHIWHSVSRYILPSGFRFPVRLPSLFLSLRYRSICPSLFFLYREVVVVVCTHTGWQIGRGISFYRMRGLHARKGRKGFRKNAIFPRPGRQRMSSAHESGYPNEIQYGNVEDHLTSLTRVHCPLYLGFPLTTKIQFLRKTHLRFDSVRSATWLPVASYLVMLLRKKNIKI